MLPEFLKLILKAVKVSACMTFSVPMCYYPDDKVFCLIFGDSRLHGLVNYKVLIFILHIKPFTIPEYL